MIQSGENALAAVGLGPVAIGMLFAAISVLCSESNAQVINNKSCVIFILFMG